MTNECFFSNMFIFEILNELILCTPNGLLRKVYQNRPNAKVLKIVLLFIKFYSFVANFSKNTFLIS